MKIWESRQHIQNGISRPPYFYGASPPLGRERLLFYLIGGGNKGGRRALQEYWLKIWSHTCDYSVMSYLSSPSGETIKYSQHI